MNKRGILLLTLGMLLGALLFPGTPAPVISAALQTAGASTPRVVPPEDGKLRIICFGDHPDDCELKAGGNCCSVVGPRSPCPICLDNQRRHWPLATIRPSPGPSP